jgi:ppGpp synthetase/RelA/SpoT-type nucleotidyltranferase
VQAYRSALEVRTKADPTWATVQHNLGLVLDDEAKGATGDRAASLHSQAEEAEQRAQEVK